MLGKSEILLFPSHPRSTIVSPTFSPPQSARPSPTSLIFQQSKVRDNAVHRRGRAAVASSRSRDQPHTNAPVAGTSSQSHPRPLKDRRETTTGSTILALSLVPCSAASANYSSWVRGAMMPLEPSIVAAQAKCFSNQKEEVAAGRPASATLPQFRSPSLPNSNLLTVIVEASGTNLE